MDELEWAGDQLLQADGMAKETLCLLETLHSSAPVGFGLIDRDFRYARVSEKLAAINGQPMAAHLGRRVAEVVPDLWPDGPAVETRDPYTAGHQRRVAHLSAAVATELDSTPTRSRVRLSANIHGIGKIGIPVGVRIMAITDTVEAMASHRPYRAALGIDLALARVEAARGIQLDPDVVDTCLDRFRTGRAHVDV